MKQTHAPSFADLAVDGRKIKSKFFAQLNSIIDWRPISNIINKHYTIGTKSSGALAYDGLLLFKMALLQTWYGLSDYEVEDRLNDSISFSKFCGLSLGDLSPDHSTLSRFRSHMTQKNVYAKLFKELNKQLKTQNIIVQTGAIVDASIIDTSLKPKGSTQYQIVDDINEQLDDNSAKLSDDINAQLDDNIKIIDSKIASSTKANIIKIQKPGVDTDAAWVKKNNKLRYGYKKHFVTDDNGLVLAVHTTAANVHEITNLEAVLNTADLTAGISIKADKGYQSQTNASLLLRLGFKNHILKKAQKNAPLTKWEQKFNKLIGQTRFKIERTFGSIKRWFNSTCARYKAIAKMSTQNLMEAMAYNLYRSPGIIMSNS